MIMIDIDMPDNCDECRFNTEYAFCKAMPDNFCGNTDDMKRPEWCPLKEQEAVEPEIHMKYMSLRKDPELTFYCGACGGDMIHNSDYPVDVIKEHYKYCHRCGRKVLWK